MNLNSDLRLVVVMMKYLPKTVALQFSLCFHRSIDMCVELGLGVDSKAAHYQRLSVLMQGQLGDDVCREPK